jgi:hypothetical protein
MRMGMMMRGDQADHGRIKGGIGSMSEQSIMGVAVMGGTAMIGGMEGTGLHLSLDMGASHGVWDVTKWHETTETIICCITRCAETIMHCIIAR